MTHVVEELELYVLGALPPADSERVAAHLAVCDGCAAGVEPLDRVISSLHDELPPREPPAALRARILRSARPVRTAAAAGAPRRWRWAALPAMAAATAVLAIVAAASLMQMDAMRAELAESRVIAERVSQPGHSWHMDGVDRWRGAGARLFVPQAAPAFVVFRGLEPAPAGQSYTVWLVDADGRWIRGASFNTDGGTTLVEVGVPVSGFDQCAVTLESRTEGRRSGPMVMQSRIYRP